MVSNGFELDKVLGSPSKITDGNNLQVSRSIGPCLMETVPEMAEKRKFTEDAQDGTLQTLSGTHPTIRFPSGGGATDRKNMQGTTSGRIKLNNFDLNNVYHDSQDCTENPERSCAPSNPGARPLDCALLVQQDSYKSSPPQTSANSDSTSARSLSTSSGEAQVYLVVLTCLRFFVDAVMIMPQIPLFGELRHGGGIILFMFLFWLEWMFNFLKLCNSFYLIDQIHFDIFYVGVN